MNSDFSDLLQLFAKHEVRYLIVGGYAVIHHAQPRFTKDLDLWLEPTTENAKRAAHALREFGIPLIEITEADLATEGTQFMVGRPPVAIDLLTSIPGLGFVDCWSHRSTTHDLGYEAHYLGKGDLIKAKQAAGRLQDRGVVACQQRFITKQSLNPLRAEQTLVRRAPALRRYRPRCVRG